MVTRTPPATSRHDPERICALYSKGPHFVRMLQRLREEYPDETIVAAIPTTYPFPAIQLFADATIRLPEAGETSPWVRPWTVVRAIRRARCSHIVVMFDSPRLNLLARVCGTGRRWCYSVDGRLHALARPTLGLVLAPVLHRVRGQMDYMRARFGTARRYKE